MSKKTPIILIPFLILPFLIGCTNLFRQPTDNPFRLTLTGEAQSFQTRAALSPEDVIATQMMMFHQTQAAYTPIPSPIPTTIASITPPIPGSVKSICLYVEQTYGEFNGPFPSSFELAQRLLKQSGFAVLQPGETCHASLDIQLILWPVAEQYSSTNGTVNCYTAAKATGTATLRRPGSPPHQIELLQGTSRQGSIITIITECPSPNEAPMEGVAESAILEALTDTIGVQTLYTAAEDEDESIRSHAIWDLYTMCDADEILVPQQLMLNALSDSSSAVRNSAIIVLGQLGKEADFAFETMVGVAKNDPDADIRSTALNYLSWIRRDDPALLSIYRTALTDPDEKVKEGAIRGLGDLEQTAFDAIPDILAYFKTHPDESYLIVSSLQEITGEYLDYELETWEAWWEEHNK